VSLVHLQRHRVSGPAAVNVKVNSVLHKTRVWPVSINIFGTKTLVFSHSITKVLAFYTEWRKNHLADSLLLLSIKFQATFAPTCIMLLKERGENSYVIY
jgi:hypothetical protein